MERRIRRSIEVDGSAFLYEQPHKKLKDACEEWLERKVRGRKAPKTVVAYEGAIKRYILPMMGDEAIGSLREAHADTLVKILSEKQMVPKTINRHLMVLRLVLRFCSREGWIIKSPFEGVELVPEKTPEIDYLTSGEVKRLLEANFGDQITYTLLVIALNTGMRVGEICGLCWDCIDFERGLIHIRRTKTKEGLAERTKTNRSRFVPINNPLRKYLLALEQNKWDDQFVIVDKKRKPIDQSHVSNRIFKKALKKADIRNIRFHDLRHTYASNFMMNGGNIFDLQKILGHTKSDMTMRYAHLSPDYLVGASNTVQFGVEKKPEFPECFQTKLRVLK